MISEAKRQMFVDLYKLAEQYENPPFHAADVEGNSRWFDAATKIVLNPFLNKYKGNQLAMDLAVAVVDEASKRAAVLNQMPF